MHAAGRTMSRRYRYEPRMTARELHRALDTLDLSAGILAKMTGTTIPNANRWLKGELDVPVHVQASLYVWERDQQAFQIAMEWADRHAYDVRDDQQADTYQGNR